MKISIVGLHHLHQSVIVNKQKLELENEIHALTEHLDRSLIDLSLALFDRGVQASLIANFSPHPKYMLALSRLEKKGIDVLPDLKDELSYDLKIHTQDNVIHFKPNTKLELANFQFKRLQESKYIITNFDSFDMLSFLSEYNQERIIVYDALPSYRALAFVQGIVFKNAPDNFELSTKSLMQSGLSWLAIQQDGYVYFRTLKHRIKLGFESVDDFLAAFIKLDEKDIVSWINQNRIN